jgi:hypothetical protein
MHAGQTSMPSLTMPTGRWFVLGVFPLAVPWPVARWKGFGMRKLMESLMLFLAKIRRRITGQR